MLDPTSRRRLSAPAGTLGIPWAAWVEASRPRMMPLALASGIIPGAVSAHYGAFSWTILVLETLLCVVLLLTSIWADDYFDLKKGVDNDRRLGPIRPVQRGVIPLSQARKGAVLAGLLGLGLGVILVFSSFGFPPAHWGEPLLFIATGLIAIWLAFAYTMGRHAYGYHGLGDLAAFLTFGVVAGLGGVHLYGHTLQVTVLLPMSGAGALFASTMNLQNLRDLENDRACGKVTTAGLMGRRSAIVYHFVLIIGAMCGCLAFPLVCGLSEPWRYAFLLAFVPLANHLIRFRKLVRPGVSPRMLDTLMWPLTRAMGLLALLFSLGVAL